MRVGRHERLAAAVVHGAGRAGLLRTTRVDAGRLRGRAGERRALVAEADRATAARAVGTHLASLVDHAPRRVGGGAAAAVDVRLGAVLEAVRRGRRVAHLRGGVADDRVAVARREARLAGRAASHRRRRTAAVGVRLVEVLDAVVVGRREALLLDRVALHLVAVGVGEAALPRRTLRRLRSTAVEPGLVAVPHAVGRRRRGAEAELADATRAVYTYHATLVVRARGRLRPAAVDVRLVAALHAVGGHDLVALAVTAERRRAVGRALARPARRATCREPAARRPGVDVGAEPRVVGGRVGIGGRRTADDEHGERRERDSADARAKGESHGGALS